MLASFQAQIYSLLDIVTLNIHAIILMHAASVALLLHGVLLTSIAGLIIRSNLSAQTLLLIGLLLNIHPKLLSYVQIPPGSIEEMSHTVRDARAVPIIREKQDYLHNEATSQTEDCAPLTVASVDNSRHLFTSDNNVSFGLMEAESPETLRCKLRKSVRDGGTFDVDKENEPSFSLPVTKRVTPISFRNGLRPLTLTNTPSLNVKGSLGPRRTVSLFNGAKRLSPLFYISDGGKEQSSPAQSADIPARRVTLPSDGLSRSRMDGTVRLQGEMQLTSKLQEEMKSTARLRNDLVELRDRACAELNQSKHEAQALAVAVDVRECFIKDLAASVEFLRVENKVLKQANRDGLRQKVSTEVFSGRNFDDNIRRISPKINSRELEQDVHIANVITQQSVSLNSAQDKGLGRCSIKRPSIASGLLTGISWDVGGRSFSRDPASWLSLGSVSEPTLEPPRDSRALIQASLPTFTSDNADCCEYAMDTSEGCRLEVEFPTISPEFPPCHTAAFVQRQVAAPSRGIVIYEVDRRALAVTQKHLVSLRHATDPAATRHFAPNSISDNSDNTCLTPNQTCHEAASCLAMKQDSPFYTVPASTFIVPRPMCPSSGVLDSGESLSWHNNPL